MPGLVSLVAYKTSSTRILTFHLVVLGFYWCMVSINIGIDRCVSSCMASYNGFISYQKLVLPFISICEFCIDFMDNTKKRLGIFVSIVNFVT